MISRVETEKARPGTGMTTVGNPKDVEVAWKQQYVRLARKFSGFIPSKRSLLAEIGCGKGQLTIPLARQAANHEIIAVDRYRRPYSREDYKQLISALERKRLSGRVSVVVSDYSHWLPQQSSDKFDGVISSEFLPEIDSIDLRTFFSECQRITKPGGIAVHSFLSPVARNLGQRLLVEADSDSRWTKDPPKEWFSPRPDFAVSQLRRAGFRGVKVVRIKSRLIFRAEAARTILNDWGVRDSFWRRHSRFLQQSGLEVSDWIMVTGVKPSPSRALSRGAT